MREEHSSGAPLTSDKVEHVYGAAAEFLHYLEMMSDCARTPRTDPPTGWQDMAGMYAFAYLAQRALRESLTAELADMASGVYPPGNHPVFRIGRAKGHSSLIALVRDALVPLVFNLLYQGGPRPKELPAETSRAKALEVLSSKWLSQPADEVWSKYARLRLEKVDFPQLKSDLAREGYWVLEELKDQAEQSTLVERVKEALKESPSKQTPLEVFLHEVRTRLDVQQSAPSIYGARKDIRPTAYQKLEDEAARLAAELFRKEPSLGPPPRRFQASSYVEYLERLCAWGEGALSSSEGARKYAAVKLPATPTGARKEAIAPPLPRSLSTFSSAERNALQALHQLKAYDQDSMVNTDTLSKRAGYGESASGPFKQTIASLGTQRLVQSKTGRGGGIWLSEAGRALLEG